MSTKVRYKSQIERASTGTRPNNRAVVTTTTIQNDETIEVVPVAILLTPASNSPKPEWAADVERKIRDVLADGPYESIESCLKSVVTEANALVFNRILGDLDAQGTQFSLLLSTITSSGVYVVRAGAGQAALVNNPSMVSQSESLFTHNGNSAYLGSHVQISPEIKNPVEADSGARVYLIADGHINGAGGTIRLPTSGKYKSGPQDAKDATSVTLQKLTSFSFDATSWLLPLLGALMLAGVILLSILFWPEEPKREVTPPVEAAQLPVIAQTAVIEQTAEPVTEAAIATATSLLSPTLTAKPPTSTPLPTFTLLPTVPLPPPTAPPPPPTAPLLPTEPSLPTEPPPSSSIAQEAISTEGFSFVLKYTDFGNGQVNFSWETEYQPPPGYGYEVFFWDEGQDPQLAPNVGYGLAPPLAGKELSINLDDLGKYAEWLKPQRYQWGIRLAKQEPYEVVEYIQSGEIVIFDGASSSGSCDPDKGGC